MSRRVVFTHNDLDGLVCALLARQAMPDAAIFFCEYSNLATVVRERLQRYEQFWFTDLSLRDDDLFRELEQTGSDVYWFDHHASSTGQGWMVECRIDLTGQKCAADVVKEYLDEQGVELPVPLLTLLDYAHDQDLWLRRIPEAQDFNDILGHLTVQQLFDELNFDLGRVYQWSEPMREACEKTQAARRRSLELARLTAREVPLADGLRLRAVCCWGSVNEVAEELGDADTLMALLDLRQLERGVLKYSLRTKSDRIAANRLAEQLGGGGHPKASGAPLGPEALQLLTGQLAEQLAELARKTGVTS